MPEFLPLLQGVLTRKLIEPEVSRRINIVTVAGRPHGAPVAAAVRAAQSYTWRCKQDNRRQTTASSA